MPNSVMKKDKPQPQLKAAKKKIKEGIQARLANLLTAITGELSLEKLAIDIEKESKKLAKKLVKGLVVKETAKPAAPAAAPVKEIKAKSAPKVSAPVKEAKAPKLASAAKKTVAKTPVAAKPAAVKAEVASKPAVVKTAAPKAVKNGAAKQAKK